MRVQIKSGRKVESATASHGENGLIIIKSNKSDIHTSLDSKDFNKRFMRYGSKAVFYPNLKRSR